MSLFAITSYSHDEMTYSIASTEQINLHLKHYQATKLKHFNRKHAVLFIQGQSDATSVAEHFLLDCLKHLKLDVVSYDVRGQGLSDGTRAHIDDFYDHLDDLSKVILFLQQKLQYEHIHFITHSTGGLIASLFAVLQGPMLSKQSSLTLIAPYFALAGSELEGFASDILSYSVSLTPARYWRIPKFPGKGGYLAEDGSMNNFSSDPDMYKNYKTHPDKCGRPTFGWLQAAIEAQRIINAEADKLNLPILMFTAADDQVVSTREARKFFNTWAQTSQHNQYIEFPSPHQHGLLYETPQTRIKMLSTISDFVDKVTASSTIKRNCHEDSLTSSKGSIQTYMVMEGSQEEEPSAPKLVRKKSLVHSTLYPAFFLFLPFATLLYFRVRRFFSGSRNFRS